jgi:hypothetical protein
MACVSLDVVKIVLDDPCFSAGSASGGGNRWDFVLGGVLHWLYLAMTSIFVSLMKALYGVYSDFLQGESR